MAELRGEFLMPLLTPQRHFASVLWPNATGFGVDGKTNDRSDSKVDQRESLCRYFEDVPGNATKWHDPASCDTGSEGKRAKGVEPSTFTLATCYVL